MELHWKIQKWRAQIGLSGLMAHPYPEGAKEGDEPGVCAKKFPERLRSFHSLTPGYSPSTPPACKIASNSNCRLVQFELSTFGFSTAGLSNFEIFLIRVTMLAHTNHRICGGF